MKITQIPGFIENQIKKGTFIQPAKLQQHHWLKIQQLKLQQQQQEQ